MNDGSVRLVALAQDYQHQRGGKQYPLRAANLSDARHLIDG
jgi:hypothetical protein